MRAPAQKTRTLRWRFVRARNFSAWLIAYFGGGDYSHIDCVLPDGTMLGARANAITLADGTILKAGVQIRPADYLGDTIAVQRTFELKVTRAQERVFYETLRSRIGSDYDTMAIAGFIVGRSWDIPGAYDCSELQAEAVETAKICGTLALTANRITPNDMSILLSGLGATSHA